MGRIPAIRIFRRLARHAVAEVDDSRAEGAGLDEFEIHPALALGEERNATANQHRVDHGPVFVDQAQPGEGDIAIGGATLAAEAAALGLIDEYRVRVYPVLVGGGLSFFDQRERRVDLELVESRTFGSGVLYLRYAVAR